MRKWILLFMGACLIALMTGCSQSSKAAGTKQTSSVHHLADHPKQKKEKHNKSAISNFSWQAFQKKQSANSKQTTPQSATKVTSHGIIPEKVKIPAINVDTDVVQKGIVKSGSYKGHMATPDNAVQVAWFKLGTKPGDEGSAIIAGHVDTYKGPGVFFNLKDLKKGDLVYVTGKQGKTLTFKVYNKEAYPRKNAPVYKVFGYTPVRTLRLLTCTGTFDQQADTHNKRLVVSAVLVDQSKS